MKILQLTRETGSDARYGIAKSLRPVIAAMNLRGHEVSLFDQAEARKYPMGVARRRAEEVYFSYLKRRYGSGADGFVDFVRERVDVAWAATIHVHKTGVSHVHCHDPLLAHAFHFFSKWSSRSVRWGFVAHGFGRFVQAREGIVLPDSVARHLQAWEFAAARDADWVVVPSHAGLKQMSVDLGWVQTPSHWHVVPHPRPNFAPTDGADVRLRFGIGDKPLVLAVGQLIPMKRFHWLIDVVAHLQAQKPHLLILGEGPQEHPLRQLALQHGMADRLHITSSDNMAPYLAAADVYVSLSSTESYGMANCEALAAGRPAVCSAVGAVPEVVGNGAWLVGESKAEISSAISHLLDSSADRALLAKRALERANTWWSPERVAVAMEDVFAGVAMRAA